MPRLIAGTLCTSENNPNKLTGTMSTSNYSPKKLVGTLSISGKPYEEVLGGVISWNSRKGEVMPEYGDYSLSMVGGTILTNTEIDDLWEDYK